MKKQDQTIQNDCKEDGKRNPESNINVATKEKDWDPKNDPDEDWGTKDDEENDSDKEKEKDPDEKVTN